MGNCAKIMGLKSDLLVYVSSDTERYFQERSGISASWGSRTCPNQRCWTLDFLTFSEKDRFVDVLNEYLYRDSRQVDVLRAKEMSEKSKALVMGYVREAAVVPDLVMTICLVLYFNGAHSEKESYEEIKSERDMLKLQLAELQRKYDSMRQRFDEWST